MLYDNAFDTPESGPHFRAMLAEIWHEWLEAVSDAAYQTHRACELLSEHGGLASPRQDSSNFRARPQPKGSNGSIDMKKLEECLQSMDSMQAARVIHAVQMMQTLDAMLQRRRTRADKEEAAW
jgi:hypothetical protein